MKKRLISVEFSRQSERYKNSVEKYLFVLKNRNFVDVRKEQKDDSFTKLGGLKVYLAYR